MAAIDETTEQDSVLGDWKRFLRKLLQNIIVAVVLSTGATIISGLGAYQSILNAIKDENTTNKIQDAAIKDLNNKIDKQAIEIEHLKQFIYKTQP